jgi:hypothetical protein
MVLFDNYGCLIWNHNVAFLALELMTKTKIKQRKMGEKKDQGMAWAKGSETHSQISGSSVRMNERRLQSLQVALFVLGVGFWWDL